MRHNKFIFILIFCFSIFQNEAISQDTVSSKKEEIKDWEIAHGVNIIPNSVIYHGIKNVVRVDIPRLPEGYSIEIRHGDTVLQHNNWSFKIIPLNPLKEKIDIYLKKPNGEYTILRSEEIRVYSIPTPSLLINDSLNGEIKKEILMDYKTVISGIRSMPIYVKVEVTEFDLTIIKSNKRITLHSDSKTIPDDISSEFEKLKPDDIVIFKNIKVTILETEESVLIRPRTLIIR